MLCFDGVNDGLVIMKTKYVSVLLSPGTTECLVQLVVWDTSHSKLILVFHTSQVHILKETRTL